MMKFQRLLLLSSVSSLVLLASPADAAKLIMWRFDTKQNRLEFTTDDGVQPKALLLANPTRLIIDLPGTTWARSTVNQQVGEGIREIRVGQLNSQTTRIVVELTPGYTVDPKQVLFQGTSSNQWSVQLPTPERIGASGATSLTVSIPTSNVSTPSNNQLETPTFASRLATIQAVDLANNGTQLLIRADQSVTATSRWNARAKTYQITIPNARLAERIWGPQLDRRSPLSQVLIRQQDSRTVVILVKPSLGVEIGELNQLTDQLLALELQQTRVAQPPTPIRSIPVPQPTRTTPPAPLPIVRNGRMVVLIDPGHGGYDVGAIGIGGLREKDVILPIAQQVALLLRQQGVQSYITRADDRFVSLEGRVQMARRAGAALFVSIHANSLSLRRPDVNGLETYYYSSQRFAQTIHYSILQSVSIRDRGVRQARFYVLRNNSMPAVLVEVGYVTGAEDARQLASPIFQRQMAEAIARGILQYMQQNF